MNTLETAIRERLKHAMMQGNTDTKDTLRMLLGEIPRLNLKAGQYATDEQLIGIAEKLIKGETELLGHRDENPAESQYIQILSEYLPEKVSEDEILDWIYDNVDFSKLKNNMQAVGMVSKHFGKAVDGKTAKYCVEEVLLHI